MNSFCVSHLSTYLSLIYHLSILVDFTHIYWLYWDDLDQRMKLIWSLRYSILKHFRCFKFPPPPEESLELYIPRGHVMKRLSITVLNLFISRVKSLSKEAQAPKSQISLVIGKNWVNDILITSSHSYFQAIVCMWRKCSAKPTALCEVGGTSVKPTCDS